MRPPIQSSIAPPVNAECSKDWPRNALLAEVYKGAHVLSPFKLLFDQFNVLGSHYGAGCLFCLLAGLCQGGNLPFHVMHFNSYSVPIPAFVAYSCALLECHDLPLWSLWRNILPQGWYERSLLLRWGRRCVLAIPGKGLSSWSGEGCLPLPASVTGFAIYTK